MKLYVSVGKPYQDYTIDLNDLRNRADKKVDILTSVLFKTTVSNSLIKSSHFVVPTLDMKPYYVHKYTVVTTEKDSSNFTLYVVFDIQDNKNLYYLGKEGSLGAIQISEPIDDKQLIIEELEKAERENNYKLKFVFTHPFKNNNTTNF